MEQSCFHETTTLEKLKLICYYKTSVYGPQHGPICSAVSATAGLLVILS